MKGPSAPLLKVKSSISFFSHVIPLVCEIYGTHRQHPVPRTQGCGKHPKELWAGQKVPWMEKGKEVRWCPHGSNRAPGSLANSQGSDPCAWMSSVAPEHPLKVGVFMLLAVDRPPPGMCLVFSSIFRAGFCCQAQQGWCLEPSWPGLSSHKSALRGPWGYRDCWGGGWGRQFHPWKALKSQIAPKEPPLMAKGAQVRNIFQGK